MEREEELNLHLNTFFLPSSNEAVPPSGPVTCASSTAREITVFYRVKKIRGGRGRRGKT